MAVLCGKGQGGAPSYGAFVDIRAAHEQQHHGIEVVVFHRHHQGGLAEFILRVHVDAFVQQTGNGFVIPDTGRQSELFLLLVTARYYLHTEKQGKHEYSE